MGGLDTPWLGVKVVGTVANVLYRTKGMTFVGHSDMTLGGVRGKDNGLATKVFQNFGVGEVVTGEISLGKVGLKHLEF